MKCGQALAPEKQVQKIYRLGANANKGAVTKDGGRALPQLKTLLIREGERMTRSTATALAITALAITALAANAGHAGELRAALTANIGGATYTDDYGNELTADIQSRSLAFEYYPKESGPFIGAAVGKSVADDYKINGSSVSVVDVDAKNTTLLVGFRGGSLGEPQVFGAVTSTRSEADGETSQSLGLHGGVERTFDGGRVSVAASYLDEEDFSSIGTSVAGVAFVSDALGISITAGTASGNGEFAGMDVDGTSWTIGFGLEIRN